MCQPWVSSSGTSHQFVISLLCQFDIALGSSLRFLLEGVKHIHSLFHSSRIDHAICAEFIPNTNFFDTLADRRHGLEIVRSLSVLHFLELIACVLPGILGKLTYGLQRVAKKPDRLHRLIISVWI